MILFIDFDGTLFHTEAFKKELGIEHVSCVENPQFCFETLSRSPDLSRFLFSDTAHFLKNNGKHRLVLLTFGHKEYQKAKVFKSGILDTFQDSIFTGDEMKGDIIKRLFPAQKESAVFLDDDFAQLQNMKARCPSVVGIRMRRKEMVYGSDITQTEFPQVSDLNEFAQLLLSF